MTCNSHLVKEFFLPASEHIKKFNCASTFLEIILFSLKLREVDLVCFTVQGLTISIRAHKSVDRKGQIGSVHFSLISMSSSFKESRKSTSSLGAGLYSSEKNNVLMR